MKRLLLLVLFNSLFSVSWADSVSSVYSTLPEGFEIVSVSRTTDSTVVHLSCHAMPGDSVSLPSAYYLSDEKGHSYPLLHCAGGRLGESNVCPLSEKVDFFLSFAPLASDVRFFDLLSSDSSSNPYSAWGIHSTNEPSAFLDRVDCRQAITDRSWLQGGHVTITGRVDGFPPSDGEGLVRLCTHPFTDELPSCFQTDVRDDGSFELDVQLDCAVWTYLEFSRSIHIPVFLVPNDTLRVVVTDFAKDGERVTYHSSAHNPVMDRLLNMRMEFGSWEAFHALRLSRPSEYEDVAAKCSAKYERLAKYLSWKYGLDAMESHLLKVYFDNILFGQILTRISDLTFTLYSPQDEVQAEAWKQLMTSEELKRMFTFLKHVDFSDASFFVMPYRFFAYKLVNTPVLSRSRRYVQKSAFDMLELLCGRSLDENWRAKVKEWPEERVFTCVM